MDHIEKSLTVLNELREYIVPLAEEELFQLEKNIVAEGCRESIIVWKYNDKLVIVDGHNRYGICRKNKLPFKTKQVAFKSLDDAKAWMIDNQMGRRNLTPDQLSYYRGVKYLSLKRKKGGYDNVKSKGQNEISTSEVLASKFTVSASTVKRDAKFAEGLDIIGKSNPRLKIKILSGEAKVNKADIQTLVNAKRPEKITIKNEADLYNKAKVIREEILDDVESEKKSMVKDKIKKAQEIINGKEPAFLDREDRLRKTKGLIISAINQAISNKDRDAIKQIKKLIDRLADDIFN